MRHVFLATLLGWDQKKEGVWFDSNDYTYDEALAEFKTYEGRTREGYPYTGFTFDGQKYYSVRYLGEYDDDKMPGQAGS